VKKIKRLLALTLAFGIILASTSLAFAVVGEGTTIKNVNDGYKLVRQASFIEIYDATLRLNESDEGTNVYYIVCKGLDFKETDMSKPRSLASAVKMGLGSADNAYVKELVKFVVDNCSTNKKPLVFIGHSMGGMVVQQAIANDEIKNNFEVLYALAIGSPYIITDGAEKEGRLIRVIDNWDPIAYLSISLLTDPYAGEVHTESSLQFGLIHFRSYEKGKCWTKYDALGIRKGSSTVTINSLVEKTESGDRLHFY